MSDYTLLCEFGRVQKLSRATYSFVPLANRIKLGQMPYESPTVRSPRLCRKDLQNFMRLGGSVLAEQSQGGPKRRWVSLREHRWVSSGERYSPLPSFDFDMLKSECNEPASSETRPKNAAVWFMIYTGRR